MASKTFDLPTPFSPAMHVKGPNSTSKSTRFLKPSTSKRVNMFDAKRCTASTELFLRSGGADAEQFTDAIPARAAVPRVGHECRHAVQIRGIGR